MIADIVGSYLDSLEEREFDAPFMALLRALGFWDIHFLHGSFEFGKDFIAKGLHRGASAQFAFQTKAGDLGLTAWTGSRGQIDMLRTNCLAHPAFDRQLPRRAVFVTTGRLVGGAPLAAQQYADHLSELGEIGFETWDRESLVEKISSSPSVGLTSSSQGAFLAIMGQIEMGDIQEARIESFSRLWFGNPTSAALHTFALQAALLAHKLRIHRRTDLACMAALALVRAAWAQNHGAEPIDATTLLVADTGRRLFHHYASSLFGLCSDDLLDPLHVVHRHDETSAHVTYPIRCLRLAEILSLLIFLEIELDGDSQRSADLTEFLIQFVDGNPGISHPISDRWAVSLIPTVLALARAGQDRLVRRLLENVVKWIADRYDSQSIGLASPTASPQEEVDYLLGDPFEHVAIHRRAESYLSTVVLDLTAVLGLDDLYVLARNEFLAVDAISPVTEVDDTTDQYSLNGTSISFSANMEYSDTWKPVDGWRVAPHHIRAKRDYYLQRIDRWWDHLAVSAVLRDRHFIETCRHFAAKLPVTS